MKTLTLKPNHRLAFNGKLDAMIKHLGWEVAPASPNRLWYDDSACLDQSFRNHRKIAINKSRVGSAMLEAFGYSVTVDPRTYQGLVVEKIEGHERHGRVVQCPIRRAHPDRVYQKLITNHPSDNFLIEFRVDVYGQELIWSHKKMFKDPKGFPLPGRTDASTEFNVPEQDYVSLTESHQLRMFLIRIGMEYGSIDVIRGLDNLIYVIDATVNVGIPRPCWHSNCSPQYYIKTSAEMFERMWI